MNISPRDLGLSSKVAFIHAMGFAERHYFVAAEGQPDSFATRDSARMRQMHANASRNSKIGPILRVEYSKLVWGLWELLTSQNKLLALEFEPGILRDLENDLGKLSATPTLERPNGGSIHIFKEHSLNSTLATNEPILGMMLRNRVPLPHGVIVWAARRGSDIPFAPLPTAWASILPRTAKPELVCSDSEP